MLPRQRYKICTPFVKCLGDYFLRNSGVGTNSFWEEKLKKNFEKLLKRWSIKLFGKWWIRLHVFKKREGEFCFCRCDFFFSGCTQILRFTQDDTRGRRCGNLNRLDFRCHGCQRCANCLLVSEFLWQPARFSVVIGCHIDLLLTTNDDRFYPWLS